MIAVDTNILVHAHRKDMTHHERVCQKKADSQSTKHRRDCLEWSNGTSVA